MKRCDWLLMPCTAAYLFEICNGFSLPSVTYDAGTSLRFTVAVFYTYIISYYLTILDTIGLFEPTFYRPNSKLDVNPRCSRCIGHPAVTSLATVVLLLTSPLRVM
jgi:hypothetical protein